MTLLLAACGGSDGSSPSAAAGPSGASAPNVVLASARKTAKAGSARVALAVSATGKAAQAISITADGITDFATGDSDLTMHFGGAMGSMFSGDLTVRSVDDVAYVQLPSGLGGILGGLTGGKQWISIDASDMAGASQGPVPGLGQSDPTQFLAYLETVSDDVKSVGTEKVRGVDTTHYTATLDLGKAVDQSEVPAELRDALQKLLAKNGGKAPTIQAEVWVDDAGRVRRLTMDLDLASFAGLAGGTGSVGAAPVVTVSIELYDFGVPVKLQAPPASDVAQLPSFGGLGGGLGGGPGAGLGSKETA